MKRVLVILVTHNGMHWLPRCLDSIPASDPGAIPPRHPRTCSVDLYVVDNDSTDGSADWIQANYPAVKLVRSAENLGFTLANNLGFDYAVEKGYDYVYLLNQDAWLEEGAIDKLVAAAEAHPEFAVLSPMQMTDGFKNYDYQFSKLVKVQEGTQFRNLCHPRHHKREGPTQWEGSRSDDSGTVYPSEPYTVKRVMAAHWLMRVEAVRQVGKFSELFPYYGQDDDWCNRARYHGWKIGIVPEARAVHDRAKRKESKERIIDRNYRVGSLVRLCDINRPLWERFLFVILFTIVKTFKYFSFKPIKHFFSICKQLPSIRQIRRSSRRMTA